MSEPHAVQSFGAAADPASTKMDGVPVIGTAAYIPETARTTMPEADALTGHVPAISLIVPVYQTEDYLDECLQSIASQSFTDLEIVCVNDGSTDGSRAILERWAATEPRLRIIDKANGGLSSARNAGIAAARGLLLMFVDSDDRILADTCEKVQAAFAAHQADIVTFGAWALPREDSYPWLERVLSPNNAVYHGFSPDILFREASRPFSWRTAVSSAFLRCSSLTFDEQVAFGEDQVFHFMAYPQSECTVFIADRLYEYRVRRPGSLMSCHREGNARRFHEHQNIARIILHGWQQRGWLASWPGPMLNWVLDFMIYDIHNQHGELRDGLLRGLRDVLAPFLVGIDLEKIGLGRASLSIYRSIMGIRRSGHVEDADPERPPTLSSLQMNLYYVEQHGFWDALKGFCGRWWRRIREHLHR
ncbi:MAG: glycosyltransferase family 2 protein [Actinomycetia bacterium]|nr:glycosyltransferase family 2 protein [Actinomycetes bacterium]